MLQLIKNKIWHPFLAWVGPKLYGNPSRKLYVIGITGTKGKSSTIELLSEIFDCAGIQNAALSSVHKKVGNERHVKASDNTMPGRLAIQKFLKEAVDAECKVAIVEVTSQGVMQNRHRYIDFDAAALTCLHPEHIEGHGSFENYRGAKVSFFRYVANEPHKAPPLFFINKKEENSSYFEAAVALKGKVIDFSKEWLLRERLKQNTLSQWFQSDFNLANAALATAIAESYGVDWEHIYKAFKEFKGVPGRLEAYSGYIKEEDGSKKLVHAIVDYAHTPVSLESVFSFLRKEQEKSAGNLICVFGSAGGGRDKWKRPEFGQIAEKYCQKIVLTSEDPYDEDPKAIIEEIKGGMSSAEKVEVIVDRKEAIEHALKTAKEGDLVAVTGMGSQQYYYGPKGAKLPWSEARIIRGILKEV
ncbi:MAG: UDP-N-acetylmuramyl-tripeptide synthetase [Candidatus Paceibacterota bacterium]